MIRFEYFSYFIFMFTLKYGDMLRYGDMEICVFDSLGAGISNESLEVRS